jgi:hypothetical protein
MFLISIHFNPFALIQVMGWIIAAPLETQAAPTIPGSENASRSLGLDWVCLLEDGACEDRC